jgi:hypothetical protein
MAGFPGDDAKNIASHFMEMTCHALIKAESKGCRKDQHSPGEGRKQYGSKDISIEMNIGIRTTQPDAESFILSASHRA